MFYINNTKFWEASRLTCWGALALGGPKHISMLCIHTLRVEDSCDLQMFLHMFPPLGISSILECEQLFQEARAAANVERPNDSNLHLLWQIL